MKYLEIIMASALFTFYFVDMARFPVKWKINFKPFNCIICLSSWVALILFFVPFWVTEIMITMFGAAIVTALLKTLMDKTHDN